MKATKQVTWLAGTLVLMVALAQLQLAAATPVSIPDPTLETAVRDALGKPTGEITDADMATLTSLGAGPTGLAGIVNLEGLQHAVNLGYLGLDGGCSVTDLSPLKDLQYLWGLDLMHNHVLTDVSPLSGLPRLFLLDLSHNQVHDIFPLRGLPLTYLDLNDNTVADISPLVGMRLGFCDLNQNYLDLTSGSDDMKVIAGLGIDPLYYQSQKSPYPFSLTIQPLGIRLAFEGVRDPGESTASFSPRPFREANFRVVHCVYYEISTTADYVGSVTITVPCETELQGAKGRSMKLMQRTPAGWMDVTESFDPVAKTVTGVVQRF